MSNSYVIAMIAVMGGVTLLIRALPFLIWSGERKTPEYIVWLGNVLPYAIMAMLVVFCLKGTNFSSLEGWVPALIACLVTGGMQAWRRNSIYSIIAGTICYMILIRIM